MTNFQVWYFVHMNLHVLPPTPGEEFEESLHMGGGGGDKMILYGLFGVQVHIRVQNMWQTWGGPGPCSPGKFWFWTFYKTQFGGIWDCFRTNVIYHVLCH